MFQRRAGRGAVTRRGVPIAVGLALLAARAASGAPLGLDERVAHQGAVEAVFHHHRVWPVQNPQPKPPLEQRMPPMKLRRKVEDYLAKSRALAELWNRPVTGEQLQAEMERMVRDTRDPGVLAELHAALGNDPGIVAECLARPALVDREIRDWYARDRRFHADVRARAERELEAIRTVAELRQGSGSYTETEWARADEVPDSVARGEREGTVQVPGSQWQKLRARLAGRFARPVRVLAPEDDVPAGEGPRWRMSSLEEDSHGFHVSVALDWQRDRLRVATLTWEKVPFAAWWGEVAPAYSVVDLPEIDFPFATSRVPLAPCLVDEWDALPGTPTLPDAREAHTAVWTGSEMIVWGGRADPWFGDDVNTGSRYCPATDSWARMSTRPGVPSSRLRHSAVWTGTEMIVWGGRNDYYIRTDTGGRYDPVTDTWMPTGVGPNVPSPRDTHTAIWTGTEMIVWGGADTVSVFDTGGRYDPQSDSWRSTGRGSNTPTGRSAQTAVWSGAEMIVWGGVDGSGRSLASGGRYDPATDGWGPTTQTNAPAGRYFHGAVWTGREMIVWGGVGGTPLATGGRYDPSTDTWLPTSTGPDVPEARVKPTAVWTGTEMIVWGGANNTALDTGARYDPAADTWTPTATGPSTPDARWWHTAVWTGTEMIVWGGYDVSDQRIASGGRYDPRTDGWIATTMESLEPRWEHTAVWTGVEMIVWGGETNTPVGELRDGARYTPATGSWSFTELGPDTPTARRYHTAVWTGTEMIVWGGNGGWDTGARYDPSMNAWSPVRTGPVPEPREAHTAVWTGTEMIVWGGYNISGLRVNTGGRYDPVADAWLPTSTGASVPSGRVSHTAVWDGNEMLIWGGNDGSPVATGGRYDPVADGWVATSTAVGVPGGRDSHTAVWTGNEMIVWGGYGTGWLQTGGRYDPVSDSWAATSTGMNVPSARDTHAAVWTGSEMIVWGGYGGWSTGGRYDPVADTWMATGTGASTPAGRLGPTAVWTGREMLVWGGFDNGYEYFADGAAYGAIVVLPRGLPAGTVGVSYLETLSSTGGSPPHSYAVTAGAPPPGLTLSPAGVLSGTPTVAGSTSFTVAVTDANGCTGSRVFELPIDCPPIIVGPPSLPDGTEGRPYSEALTAVGGAAPYTFSITGGTLPPGLSLDPTTGAIAGTPLTPGGYGFLATATDADGCTGTTGYAIAIEPGALVDYVVGEGLGPTSGNLVRIFDGTGTATSVNFAAYAAGGWGTNIASGHLDPPSPAEIVTGPGPGAVYGPQVRGFRADGTPMGRINFFAYATLRYGVNVAVSDVDGGGLEEILSGAGPGSVFGPHVRGWSFDGVSIAPIPAINLFAYGTLKLGVNVQRGDIDGDAFAEILAGPGPGAAFDPTVRAFDYDGVRLAAIAKVNFNPFSQVGYGANVAGGDVDDDRFDEIVTTPGPGPSHPSTFSGFDYDGLRIGPLPGFVYRPFSTLHGGRVGTGDVSGDGRADLICGAGRDPAATSQVKAFAYTGSTLSQLAGTFTPFGGGYGVNVSGGELGY